MPALLSGSILPQNRKIRRSLSAYCADEFRGKTKSRFVGRFGEEQEKPQQMVNGKRRD